MKLTVQQAAKLLDTNAERVYDWIEDGSLPALRIAGQYRINRTELLEWATARKIAVAPLAFAREDDPTNVPSLSDALRAGGIHHHVEGGEIPDVLRRIIELLPLADDADREMLAQILLARDALGLTSIGDGIAIPHVRTPLVLASDGAIAALAFVVSPLPMESLDGEPVDTLFFLVTPTVHAHLAMLAKLAFSLRARPFRDAVRRRAPAEELFAILATMEGA